MLDHYLQRDIVYRLAFTDNARFSDIKPDDIENKLFTYHLQKLIAAGYVEKNEEGFYSLTAEGRRVGVGAFRTHHMAMDRAYSVLILAIRRADGAWLLYRRNTHPLRGLSGFMHVIPNAIDDAPTRAQKECLAKTGLNGSFTIAGEGYFRVYDGEELESFTHFTLLRCDDIEGELTPNNDLAEYYWVDDPDFANATMLPNMKDLAELCADENLHFIERTYHL